MLAWGRVGRAAPAAGTVGAPPSAPGQGPETQADDLIPVSGGEWPVELPAEDCAYLMGLFLGSLSPSAEPVPEAGAAPATVTRPVGAPVFVTIYEPGKQRVRVAARRATLAESVRQAAHDVRERSQRPPAPHTLRLRIDVLRQARFLPTGRRVAFACRGFGPPLGVALRSGDRFVFFLPADVADYQAETHEMMLQAVCRQAGLDPSAWQMPSVTMWRLETAGFVNAAPGSRHALPSPRGLTSPGEPNIARLLRANRLLGQYLARVQKEDGAYLNYWDPASGLATGCDSVPEQAGVAAALAELCELLPKQEYLTSCYEAVSYFLRHTDMVRGNRPMAFTRRDEACRDYWETEASAQVLEALCRYRRVSGLTEPDPWIAALAEFLLFMQREDGGLELQYDVKTGGRSTPRAGAKSVTPQAKAALALALAYRELRAPAYLQGACRALDALWEEDSERKEPHAPQEARWLAMAAEQVGAASQTETYHSWVKRIAAGRRQAQLVSSDVPAADLVGGTLSGFPPLAGHTADDLVVFTVACMMDATGDAENRSAARRAARYIMQLQFLPENSYYLVSPSASSGGVREYLGSNLVKVQTLESVLRGLVALARLELQDVRQSD
jgi:hypothetical protein